jgi:hypothetical protein
LPHRARHPVVSGGVNLLRIIELRSEPFVGAVPGLAFSLSLALVSTISPTKRSAEHKSFLETGIPWLFTSVPRNDFTPGRLTLQHLASGLHLERFLTITQCQELKHEEFGYYKRNRKMRTCFTAFALLTAIVTFPSLATAQSSTVVGVGVGAVTGAAVAGPPGAVVGGVVGGLAGHSMGRRHYRHYSYRHYHRHYSEE